MSPPRVAIIVLCYNGSSDTLACLASLRRSDYPQAQVVVLDNASQDDTPAKVREHFPEVLVIENGANLGFAAGNNVGLRYALAEGYDYALLLNNDTEVAPDFLSLLVAAAEADPQRGALGPMIYYYEAPTRIWSAGGQIDWQRGVCSMAGEAEDVGQYATPRDVDFVTGCALLMRRTALERAGLLDERFFMYFEESEWCVRVARAGMRIRFVPQARVWHKIPLNARFDKEYLAYYMTRNRLLFLRATGAPWRTWLHALILQDLRTYASLCLRPKWRKRSGRSGMRLAWRDFWRGRFGRLAE
ncbi:MAG: glycosyltransferase family 2 protein [Candidatus Viridilinea halotolerans]|uniref:Glycosyltransferase family 2 protein n=1 Tax=Candidatus Viridilinea halotolerans TaxID=2491704 RepID=A0A426U152_9CHLR|nr:MAG: glycosyltransferase family 2 protein [Candidatus Viridilinea halotolerans]